MTTHDWMRCGGMALGLALAGCSTSADVKPMPPTTTTETTRKDDSVTQVETETVQAKVVAIDQKTRMVTLQGADGEELTFRASDDVKNLPQVRKGDIVTVVHKQALALRLRKPGEVDPGPQVGEGVATAPLGEKPAAAGVEAAQITATVTKVDKAKQTITLRGPKGKHVTLKVQDPKRLDQLKKGDKIEVTYTEAVAISVDKP